MADIKINIFPIEVIQPKISIFLNNQEDQGFNKINHIIKEILSIKINPLEKEGHSRYSFKKINECKEINIDISDKHYRYFIKPYIQQKIANYLKHNYKDKLVVSNNFISDIFIWNIISTDNKLIKYEKFDISVHLDKSEFGLLISYSGISSVYNKPISLIPQKYYPLIRRVFNPKTEENIKFEELNIDDYSSYLPLLNRDLRKELLDTSPNTWKKENPYKIHTHKINSFYLNYLKDQKIDNITIFSSGFKQILNSRIIKIKEDSNKLTFGNGRTNFNVYNGLKLHGAYQTASGDSPTKFIFIFPNDQKSRDLANTLYLYLKKGYKNYPGLKEFIGIDFLLDKSKSIIFNNPNPISEVREFLSKNSLEQNVRYVAIYLSPYDKTDEINKEIYYKLKELLLNKKITSQVVRLDRLLDKNYNYYLPNISISILAKIGGKPWILDQKLSNSIVVGFGATKKNKETYLGNTVSFNSNGDFKEFNAFRQNSIQSLGKLMKESLISLVEKDDAISSLIIHFYKPMNRSEQKELEAILDELDLRIPYVVLNVNESKRVFSFDANFEEKMPVSGTIVKYGYNDFLLYNNTRYSEHTRSRIDKFPFPVRIRISKSEHINTDDPNVVSFLLNQVYQFSRIYWKSVSQRSLPVTIEYSKIIADMVSNFDNSELPNNSVARQTLWFI